MKSGDHAQFVRLLARALAYHRAPETHARHMANAPVRPVEFALLFRLAGGAPLEKFGIATSRVRDPGELRSAARAYIQHVLFQDGADPYRVLGLLPHASPDEIKEHHRLLMRLTHPDRAETSARWHSSYVSRINQAYNTLTLRATTVIEDRSASYTNDYTVWEGVTGIGSGQRSTVDTRSFYQRHRVNRALLVTAFGVALLTSLFLAVVYLNGLPATMSSFAILDNKAMPSEATRCADGSIFGQPPRDIAPGDMSNHIQRVLEARVCIAQPPGEVTEAGAAQAGR
jgi:hypothetical protein